MGGHPDAHNPRGEAAGQGSILASVAWDKIQAQILGCIKGLEWPKGSGKFILHDQSGKKRGEGSGVTPIKNDFIRCLEQHGWLSEQELDIATLKKPGPIDAIYPVGDKHFALEWETGNISSSHRAMNKMVLIRATIYLTQQRIGGKIGDEVSHPCRREHSSKPFFIFRTRALALNLWRGCAGRAVYFVRVAVVAMSLVLQQDSCGSVKSVGGSSRSRPERSLKIAPFLCRSGSPQSG
jgi:hypothetical protein